MSIAIRMVYLVYILVDIFQSVGCFTDTSIWTLDKTDRARETYGVQNKRGTCKRDLQKVRH